MKNSKTKRHLRDKRYKLILDNCEDILLDCSKVLKKEAKQLARAKPLNIASVMRLCDTVHVAADVLVKTESVMQPLPPIGEYISNDGIKYKFI